MAVTMEREQVHVKKGDMVEVIAGRQRGKRGKVLKVLPKHGKVIIEGVNVVKRHTKPTQKMPQGGVVEKEAPVYSSRVMMVCPKCGRAARVGHGYLADGANVRVGDATTDSRFLDKAAEELAVIAGQRPVIPRAKKSIAAFKLRRGLPIAAKVTLRGDRMYQFVDKLFNIALPRIKDFKGISERQFDGRGNLNIGVREQLIFPEIDYDKVEKVRGMDITLVTTAQTDEEARELLRLLGLPLREAGAVTA